VSYLSSFIALLINAKASSKTWVAFLYSSNNFVSSLVISPIKLTNSSVLCLRDLLVDSFAFIDSSKNSCYKIRLDYLKYKNLPVYLLHNHLHYHFSLT